MGEDGRATYALEALEFSGGAPVEVLQPPVDADHDHGKDDEQGRLDGVDDEGGGADEADENETLKVSTLYYLSKIDTRELVLHRKV